MSLNDEQPKPQANDNQPSWEAVIAFCREVWPEDDPTAQAVMADMAERNESGIKKYGVPLQPHNGRRALIDAYQEALDQSVYLMQWLQENPEHEQHAVVRAIFMSNTGTLPMLRELIDLDAEQPPRA